MVTQVFWGSLVLGLCSTINLVLMIGLTHFLRRFRVGGTGRLSFATTIFIISSTFAAIVLAHTIQIWVWAFFLILLGALSNYADAVYFSLVTFTTVGYGDVTLTPEFRIFGAMASITGLLGFGISTAFLVETLVRVFPARIITQEQT